MNAATLSRWLLWGEWRAHWLQVLVALLAIATGVAMAFSIHLINTAAFNEFSAASKSLSGESDLQVHGRSGFFDEMLYPRLAGHDGVQLANPVLELDVTVPGKQQNRNDHRLKIMGIDMLRAMAIAPDLIGLPEEGKSLDRFASDTIFLSPAAMEWLQVQQHDYLELHAGLETVTLRVAGGLVRARAGQRLAVMDIGAMQWRFQQLGVLSRIELKLENGVNHAAFKAKLSGELGEAFIVTEQIDQEQRIANMSRAYRVNLNMLALVALFTGTFLVFFHASIVGGAPASAICIAAGAGLYPPAIVAAGDYRRSRARCDRLGIGAGFGVWGRGIGDSIARRRSGYELFPRCKAGHSSGSIVGVAIFRRRRFGDVAG